VFKIISQISASQPAIDYGRLKKALSKAEGDDAKLFKAIVNAPFDLQRVEMTFFFLGIIVFLLVNEETGTIDRLALSNTELAQNTLNVSVVPFEKIKIPVDYDGNIIAKAIKSGEHQETTDWKDMFEPALTAEQARINQASAGIACSVVHPLQARSGGALIFSYFQYKSSIGEAQQEFMKKYAGLVSESLRA
jgi:hypothetical protein